MDRTATVRVGRPHCRFGVWRILSLLGFWTERTDRTTVAISLSFWRLAHPLSSRVLNWTNGPHHHRHIHVFLAFGACCLFSGSRLNERTALKSLYVRISMPSLRLVHPLFACVLLSKNTVSDWSKSYTVRFGVWIQVLHTENTLKQDLNVEFNHC